MTANVRISRRKFLKLGGGMLATGLVGSYPFVIERYRIDVNRYRITIKDLPKAFVGFTILHLSDIHYGPFVPLWWLRRVFGVARSLAPDLIALTGDYVRGRESARDLEIIWPELERLKAPWGVRMVLGNHDHWAGHNRAIELLEGGGCSLRNRSEVLRRGEDELVIGGVGDYMEDDVLIDQALSDRADNTPRIMLAHNPDTADLPYNSRVDLFLCGHTHGGQVNIPFIGTPVLPVRNKNYNYGIRHSGRSTLFINKGIGWAMIPIRFNCCPEIAVIELLEET